MLSAKEIILTNILNCGTADLDMLEDINYDMDEIIDELQENDNLSLESIFETVFSKAADELEEAFNEQKEEIRSCIEYELETERKECIESGEMTEEELNEIEEHISLINNLELLTGNKLNPKEDITYYFNCLDTHVFLENLEFYKKYMESTIDDIEYKMGLSFSE